MERESRATTGDKINDEMFKNLLVRVREYSANRRLEAAFKRNKGDPMDVSQVNTDYVTEYPCECYYQEAEYVQDYTGGLDALGKGKGKGKGMGKGKGGAKGPCWTCGQLGHQQWECPKGKGKGQKGHKGLGRGPQFGNCWTCGGSHYQADVPKEKERA